MRHGRRLGACTIVAILSLASPARAEGGHASSDNRRYASHSALELLQKTDLEYFIAKREADRLVRARGLGALPAAFRWGGPGTPASVDAPGIWNPAAEAFYMDLRSKRSVIPPGLYLFGRAGAVRWRTPIGGCDKSSSNCAFNLGIRPNGIPKIPGSNLYVGVYFAF